MNDDGLRPSFSFDLIWFSFMGKFFYFHFFWFFDPPPGAPASATTPLIDRQRARFLFSKRRKEKKIKKKIIPNKIFKKTDRFFFGMATLQLRGHCCFFLLRALLLPLSLVASLIRLPFIWLIYTDLIAGFFVVPFKKGFRWRFLSNVMRVFVDIRSTFLNKSINLVVLALVDWLWFISLFITFITLFY